MFYLEFKHSALKKNACGSKYIFSNCRCCHSKIVITIEFSFLLLPGGGTLFIIILLNIFR